MKASLIRLQQFVLPCFVLGSCFLLAPNTRGETTVSSAQRAQLGVCGFLQSKTPAFCDSSVPTDTWTPVLFAIPSLLEISGILHARPLTAGPLRSFSARTFDLRSGLSPPSLFI